MSYIPPLVCDTPPPIDFEDSHEDDFGDGMFSNYDGSSLPTTPKQLSSVNFNDHDDLPIDIPELPDLPQFPDITEAESVDDYQNSKESVEFTDLPLSNVLVTESSFVQTKIQPQFMDPIVKNGPTNIDNSKTETVSSKILKVKEVGTSPQFDLNSHSEIKDVTKQVTSEILENTLSSPSNSNVYRGESPPSLVFSAESLNCDDNQSEDFEEFQHNNDDIECNLPSLKLDSISDTKSQSSDLEETNNSVDSELGDIQANSDIKINNSNSENIVEKVDSPSVFVEYHPAVTNTDDSFDDFVEYEANVVADSHQKEHEFIEYQAAAKPHEEQCPESIELKHSDENAFAADFSQFKYFSENKINEPVQCEISEKHEADHNVPGTSSLAEAGDDFKTMDDDDEFGEFNDFNDFDQSQTFVPSLSTNVDELTAKIKPLLDDLFPSGDTESDDSNYHNALDLTNDTTKIIKDFENSKALDHQWISSVGKSSLVTALGIDSRNILYGGKWNSSMPRFAANLGFSPLEPIKPSSVCGTTSGTNSSVSNEIPAAQFDWNSSGLVNPLDGVQEILHKTNAAENKSSRTELDWHSTKAEPPLIAQTAPLSNIHTTLNINANNFIDNDESTQTSASYVVPGSSGTLKETHIFTPSKSPYSLPLSRDVSNDKHESKCSDFDYEKAAAGIIINENVVKKEYRDIEYDPDSKPAISTVSNDDFSDYQSVPIPIATQKPYQNILSMDFGILQPTKRNDSITINWPDPGNVVNSTNLESFDNFISAENVSANSIKRKSTDFGKSKSSSSSIFGEFAKPVIGVSPSEIMFETNSSSLEDEFSDFQCVEPISSQNKFIDVIPTATHPTTSTQTLLACSSSPSSPFGHHASTARPQVDVTPSNQTEILSNKTFDNNSVNASEAISSFSNTWNNYQAPKVDVPITPTVPATQMNQATKLPSTNILQPSQLKPLQMLTPQLVNSQPPLCTNTIWPESEIDPDEIARLEAIFPQAPKQSQSLTTIQTAFESKPQSQNSSIPQEDDEWSDFVSVPTLASQPLPITNIISANIVKHQQDDDEWSDFVSSTSQEPVQPWNYSSGPNFTSWNAPPQFDSWQSSTLAYQPPQQFVPTVPSTISSNPSLISSHQAIKTNSNSFFTPKAPSISLIPDLSFVAPKTLVNRSRTNYQSK